MKQLKVAANGIWWVVLVILFITPSPCFALITGEHGNQPITNRGWPLGAERVANLPSRLGYWEGPPFGGGQYQFLYRCSNTAQFNEALKFFSEILAPKLELVVHDGPEYSFWLKDDSKDEPQEVTRVDWTFTVWIPKSWHHLYNNPKSVFSSDDSNFRNPVPPPRIDVYIGGGSITWEEIEVPHVANIQRTDKRADSAPLKPVGGGLVRGDIYDMATGQPIPCAEITLAKRNGQNGWDELARAKTDDVGSFKIEKIPAGHYEIRIRAQNYASRKQGAYYNKGNTYHEFIAELVRQASIKGIVTDSDGKPISGVEVSARNTLAIDGLGYPCVDAESATTDEEGRFEISQLPEGFALLNCRASSLHQVTSIFELYEIPARFHDSAAGVIIVMEGTGAVRVIVTDEDGNLPSGEVHVSIKPPGGGRAGQWGGSARCNDDGTFEFKGVPSGDYVVSVNPGLMVEGKDPDVKLITTKVSETVEVKIVKRKR